MFQRRMVMIFHSKEALEERPYDQLGIEGLGLSKEEAVYLAQSLDGLSNGIPLSNQYVIKDDRGYGYTMGGRCDYKKAYEDTKKIFSQIQGILLNNKDRVKEYSDLKQYELHYPDYEGALKHLNGAKETKEILQECSEATGLSPDQFMDRALQNARLRHVGKAGLEPTSDKKVNMAVEMFEKRSFEVPTLSENIYYGSQNRAGDFFRTMPDIDRSMEDSEAGVNYHKSEMPKDFSDYSKKEIDKIKATWEVYRYFKEGMKEIGEKSWYKEQRKEDIRCLAHERVGVEEGKNDNEDKLAQKAKNFKEAKSASPGMSSMKRALDERLGRI